MIFYSPVQFMDVTIFFFFEVRCFKLLINLLVFLWSKYISILHLHVYLDIKMDGHCCMQNLPPIFKREIILLEYIYSKIFESLPKFFVVDCSICDVECKHLLGRQLAEHFGFSIEFEVNWNNLLPMEKIFSLIVCCRSKRKESKQRPQICIIFYKKKNGRQNFMYIYNPEIRIAVEWNVSFGRCQMRNMANTSCINELVWSCVQFLGIFGRLFI